MLGDLFAGPPFGTGIFTAALILAVMIIPFIAATMRDVFLTVPPVFKESRLRRRLHDLGGDALDRDALHARVGGRRHHAGPRPRARRDDGGDLRDRQHQPHHHNLFGSGNTIASLVALEFPESETGSLKLSSLLALGFILFVISFIVLAISRLLLRPRRRHEQERSDERRDHRGRRIRPGAATLGRDAAVAPPPARVNCVVKVLCILATVIGLAVAGLDPVHAALARASAG